MSRRIRAGGEAARIAPHQIVGAFNLEAAVTGRPNNDLIACAQSSFAKGPYRDRDLMLGRNLAHPLYQTSRNVKPRRAARAPSTSTCSSGSQSATEAMISERLNAREAGDLMDEIHAHRLRVNYGPHLVRVTRRSMGWMLSRVLSRPSPANLGQRGTSLDV